MTDFNKSLSNKKQRIDIIILFYFFVRWSHIAPVLQKRAWMKLYSKSTSGADPRCARVVRALCLGAKHSWR